MNLFRAGPLHAKNKLKTGRVRRRNWGGIGYLAHYRASMTKASLLYPNTFKSLLTVLKTISGFNLVST